MRGPGINFEAEDDAEAVVNSTAESTAADLFGACNLFVQQAVLNAHPPGGHSNSSNRERAIVREAGGSGSPALLRGALDVVWYLGDAKRVYGF